MYDDLTVNLKNKLFFHNIKQICYELSFEHEILAILAKLLEHTVNYFDARNGNFYLLLNRKIISISSIEESKNIEIVLSDDDEKKLIATDFVLEEEELSFYPSLSVLSESSKVRLLMPLSYNNNLFGFITLGGKVNHLEYDEVEKLTLALIINFISRMVFYSHSYIESSGKTSDEIYMKNIVDPLSGVYIKSYIEQRMTESMKEAIRYKKPDSCLLVKIDKFSEIRTKYGQQSANSAFQSVGNSIRTFLRKDIDLAGKFSDDSFLILLPSTDHKGSIIFSERLRLRLDKLTLDKNPSINLTISIGVTSLEANDKTKDAFLKKAKDALDHSVQVGGNKVTFHYDGSISENLSHFEKATGISSDLLKEYIEHPFFLVDENGDEIDFTKPMHKTWINIPKQH